MPQAKNHSIPKNTDPLMFAGEELRRLETTFAGLDLEKGGEGWEVRYRDAEKRDILDRIFILRDFLSTTRARSIADCLVQLDQMSVIADQFMSGDDDPDWPAANRAFRRLYFSIEKHLSSIVLEAAKRVYREENQHLDPWRPYQELVAAVRRAA